MSTKPPTRPNLLNCCVSRHRIEMHLLKRDTDGDAADPRPVMGRRPESMPARVLAPSLYKLLPLKRRSEELRRLACTDVVGLAATFRQDARLAALYRMGPWPQLCKFVRRQVTSSFHILSCSWTSTYTHRNHPSVVCSKAPASASSTSRATRTFLPASSASTSPSGSSCRPASWAFACCCATRPWPSSLATTRSSGSPGRSCAFAGSRPSF